MKGKRIVVSLLGSRNHAVTVIPKAMKDERREGITLKNGNMT